jgi:hypothetical protein
MLLPLILNLEETVAERRHDWAVVAAQNMRNMRAGQVMQATTAGQVMRPVAAAEGFQHARVPD